MTWSTVDSPIGELTVVAEDGALVGLYMTGHRPAPDPESFGERVDDALPAATAQLTEYFAGERTAFDLPLAPRGTAFQQAVWAALRDIPYGETRSYGELAAALGRPGASRAVGLANGRNPISIVVPCHRVVGAGGKLTGYAGGMERKSWLLALELSGGA
ncbi:methylated-DNA--[protein]-cysteine S-methyltransferase [Tessaracoccus defluvii]|uniref:Methylated-DNA--protein-cysteine methyltransferase n=1 Tax=Tessaracoccus defluvii TaxID=1285901 RepID=A0A7H0H3J5_9ACTN|nr:methylated-DNA--[protein]-cysteine S-methyltransferase [Tessaracoccus defluvii]QNP55111.1 methylated-DNA--[protein]-cysteine S-methyltransferase [Tessaracoccus defluvii]